MVVGPLWLSLSELALLELTTRCSFRSIRGLMVRCRSAKMMSWTYVAQMLYRLCTGLPPFRNAYVYCGVPSSWWDATGRPVSYPRIVSLYSLSNRGAQCSSKYVQFLTKRAATLDRVWPFILPAPLNGHRSNCASRVRGQSLKLWPHPFAIVMVLCWK